MQCPNCQKEISQLDEKCKYCGKEFKEEDSIKTIGIVIINVIQAFILFFIGLNSFMDENTIEGITFWVIAIVTSVFLKGFADIINLLDSINRKLDK